MERFGKALLEAARAWQADGCATLAAAMSYHALFGLAPLLLVAIGVAGLFLGGSGAREAVLAQVASMMGSDAATALGDLIDAARVREGGLLATAVGTILLLLGASGLVAQLQSALNRIWRVQPDPDRGILGTIRARFQAVGAVVGLALLTTASLVAGTALSLPDAAGSPARTLAAGAQVLLDLALFTGLFAFIYRVLPDVEIRWSQVRAGALTVAALFIVGRLLLGLYLARASPASAFGAAGSLVVILLWIHYSSMLLFFGVELTRVQARQGGTPVRPARGAIRLDGAWPAA